MTLQCFFLGLLQGVTEFLPVSSSGHLVIAQELLGWSEPALSFDIMLHFATMAATVFFFRKEISKIGHEWILGLFFPSARELPGWRYGWTVALGTVVTVITALAAKPLIVLLFRSALFVGFALIVTGAVLCYGATIIPKGLKVKLSTGAIVGFAQGLAVFPGISRSGLTIVTGLRAGLDPEESFSFSFLLSLPAITGATVLELLEAGGFKQLIDSLPPGWWAGMIAAFVSGLAALGILRKVVARGRWRGFSIYCLAAGSLVLVLNLIRG